MRIAVVTLLLALGCGGTPIPPLELCAQYGFEGMTEAAVTARHEGTFLECIREPDLFAEINLEIPVPEPESAKPILIIPPEPEAASVEPETGFMIVESNDTEVEEIE